MSSSFPSNDPLRDPSPEGGEDLRARSGAGRDASERSSPLVVRIVSAFGLAGVAAAVCVIPAAIRLGLALGGVADVGRVWLALAAAMFVPMFVAIAILRGTWSGLATFAGPSGAARAFGVVVWLAATFVALAAFGTLLRATTHHHALAGVTFAAAGAVVVAVVGLVAFRLVALLAPGHAAVLRVLTWVVAVTFVLFSCLAGVRLVGAPPGGGAPSGVADWALCGLGALMAAHPALARRRPVAFTTAALAGPLFIVGLAVLRSSAAPYDIVTERAPALSPVVRLLAGR